MKIKKAEFIRGYSNVKQCPSENRAEFAFIGRSNVGKSSLLNYLVGNKGLAKVSSKPGKTRLFNYFLINDFFYIVDLPGYGYAKFSKTERDKWEKNINEYIFSRVQLLQLFLLIDARIPPQKNDLNMIQLLGENQVPFSIVFTKVDKLSKNQLRKNFNYYQRVLLESWEQLPDFFFVSSVEATGKEDLIRHMENLLKSY